MKKKPEISLDKLPESVRAHIVHLERVRRDFVANVSHELRTPLTVIQGYLEALLAQNLDETKPWKKIFSQMYQHSIRMANIIEDLLLLSILETDDYPLQENANINIKEMLQTLVAEARNISGDKKHSITLKADPEVRLNGAENELKSLFSNLIINAIKYTPAKGKIKVYWGQEQGRAVFKVSDTGIGIAKKEIPRITERFYRVDKGRSRESGGTGLGLAIVKHILIRHQSELSVASQLGKGSTFTCLFPPARTVLNL
ncbi:MAG: two-component sensor histidine kinase [Proteobacteria bacterium]|nr:two-component sensor histidine kinase [Pseudomonadota bacterium]